MRQEFISVALLRPGHHAKVGVMENTLEAFQKAVGGNIQIHWPPSHLHPQLIGTVCVCNEEGLYNIKDEFNGHASALGLVIGGNVVVCNEVIMTDDTPFVSLTDDAIVWMQKRFPSMEITVELLDFSETGEAGIGY